jgi:hypothetical protein
MGCNVNVFHVNAKKLIRIAREHHWTYAATKASSWRKNFCSLKTGMRTFIILGGHAEPNGRTKNCTNSANSCSVICRKSRSLSTSRKSRSSSRNGILVKANVLRRQFPWGNIRHLYSDCSYVQISYIHTCDLLSYLLFLR